MNRQTDRQIKWTAGVAFIMALLIAISLCGCSDVYVNALDYGLENELYSGMTQEQPVDNFQPNNSGEAKETHTETQDIPTNEPVIVPPPALPEPDPSAPNGDPTLPIIEEEVIETVVCKVVVLDAGTGAAVQDARVELYQDGDLTYTQNTNGNGSCKWKVEIGKSFSARASAAGYKSATSAKKTLGSDGVITIRLERNEQTPTPSLPGQATPSPEVGTVSPSPSPLIEEGGEPTDPNEGTVIGEGEDPDSESEDDLIELEEEEYTGGIVTITLHDITVKSGDVTFDLMQGVNAVDEKGQQVYVWIMDGGWFNIDVAGEYNVTYAALEGKKIVTAERIVIVEGDTNKLQIQPNAPTSSSNARYLALLKQVESIRAKLYPQMQKLNAGLNEELEALKKQGKTETVRMFRETALLEDDSMPESGDEAFLQTTKFTIEDTLTVNNWADILAVYIATHSNVNVKKPLDLLDLSGISWNGLGDVFQDMVSISTLDLNGSVEILLTCREYEEMPEIYQMSEKQTDLLYLLMQPEFQRVFSSLSGNTAFDDLSEETIAAIRASLPAGVSVNRESVLKTAYALVGKLNYFWGGKSNKLGWNAGWGLPRIVTSENSRTTGTERSYGMDCSGYVSWVFINALGSEEVLGAIGNGSSNQWSRSKSIGWDEARPGDLTFRSVPGAISVNHVGIVVEKKADGSYLIAHCSSSKNGVVITEAWSSGFRYMRRPALYDD